MDGQTGMGQPLRWCTRIDLQKDRSWCEVRPCCEHKCNPSCSTSFHQERTCRSESSHEFSPSQPYCWGSETRLHEWRTYELISKNESYIGSSIVGDFPSQFRTKIQFFSKHDIIFLGCFVEYRVFVRILIISKIELRSENLKVNAHGVHGYERKKQRCNAYD